MRSLTGLVLISMTFGSLAAQADGSVLDLVGKGRFTAEREIDRSNLKEFESINSLGCDKAGWGALSDGKMDIRLRPGMTMSQYFEQSGDDGHRAGAVSTKIDTVKTDNGKITATKTSTALLTQGFDVAAPGPYAAAHRFPVVGSVEKSICVDRACTNFNELEIWSIVNEVGQSNAKGVRCGLTTSTSDMTVKLEKGTYTFADGRKVTAYRETSVTRYPVNCVSGAPEKSEETEIEIRTNDLPALGLPWDFCGGVEINRFAQLKSLTSGKIFWTRKSEILKQN